MKKRVFAILISVAIISLGVFGANILFAQQSSKKVTANTIPQAPKEPSSPAEVANANVPANPESPSPPTQDKTSQQKQITYDAISPAISPISVEYMPSNRLSAQDNFSLSDIAQNLIHGWTGQANEDKYHQKDSLINGSIKG